MCIKRAGGGMADATDLKSVGRKAVGVQVPPCPLKFYLPFNLSHQ